MVDLFLFILYIGIGSDDALHVKVCTGRPSGCVDFKFEFHFDVLCFALRCFDFYFKFV